MLNNNQQHDKLYLVKAALSKLGIKSNITIPSTSAADVVFLSAVKKPSYEVVAASSDGTYDIWSHRKNCEPRMKRTSLTLKEIVAFYTEKPSV